MESQTIPPTHLPLGDAIARILGDSGALGPSIGEITSGVGEKGFGLLLVILALPSALPVPAPGYSTPFGIAIALIALQMMCGRRTVWLPQRLAAMRLRPKLAAKMLGAASGFLRRVERWIRPRQRWIASRTGQAALSTVVLIMAGLMMLPIPLTNTFPAMVIFILGVGLSEEDGYLAIGAFAAGCLAVLLYAGVIYLLLTQGPEAIEGVKDWLKIRLGFD
ncbi:MAG: exopolysaccharide biosynthesis protein [Opitutales bacterium]